MKKNIIIILALLILNIGFASAALGWGSWISNHDIQLTINNGQSAEFEYTIQAVSNYRGVQGVYSISLYEEGNDDPIKTYFNSQQTLNNGAGGYIDVLPEHYENQPGNYILKIISNDYFGYDVFVMKLNINPVQNPLTVSCNADHLSGPVRFTTAFTATAAGGSGVYDLYGWDFKDGTTNVTTTNYVQHTYETANNYIPTITVKDSMGHAASAECPRIEVKPKINDLIATCSAIPTSGTAPLNVYFTATALGGSGAYAYEWDFDDGIEKTAVNNANHVYSDPGTYNPVLTVSDSDNSVVTANCPEITAMNQTKGLYVKYINCFDTVVVHNNQSCQVFVESNNNPVGDATIKMHFSDGSFFGECQTDRLSGGCIVNRQMNTIGRYTVYATASKPGYISDEDTWPRKTFDVYGHRYDIINLATYNDWLFHNKDDVFYRGEALYVRFQIYDTFTHSFVTEDVVTASSLLSPPGGRADLAKMNFFDNWYSYRLDQIPLTHEFLGNSNVFAFAFNLSDQTGGQAQTDLTILNNIPKISPIPDINIKVDEIYKINLKNYAYDLEDKYNIRWTLSYNSEYFDAEMNNTELAIKGLIEGKGIITLHAYDRDNDYASRIVNVNVSTGHLPGLNVQCSADPISGTAPLNVDFDASISGGNGPYSVLWDFDDDSSAGSPAYDSTQINHLYQNPGTYHPKVTVQDNDNNIATADCPEISVKKNETPIFGICLARPTSGYVPLTTRFVVIAFGSYSYDWDFDDGSSSNEKNPQHTYTSTGVFRPKVVLTNSAGYSGTINCPNILVLDQSYNQSLIAYPNGPYKGFMNEQLMFDGSGSTGGIIKYVWDFGDGNVVETASPYINYTYVNKIGVFDVKLTVYDGFKSASAMTTATIIERTNFLPDEDDSISNELYFERINYYGNDGIYEHAKSNDDVTFDIRLHNHGSYKLEDARIIIEIPELGIKQKSAAFGLNAGAQRLESMIAEFYNVPKGMYYVKIIVQDDNVKHVKYREIYVDSSTKCNSC